MHQRGGSRRLLVGGRCTVWSQAVRCIRKPSRGSGSIRRPAGRSPYTSSAVGD